MPDTNINATTTPTIIQDYSVGTLSPDSPLNLTETYYDNPNFTKWFANYKNIAKIKKAIDGYATWIIGKGLTTDTNSEVILEHIDGWGEDTFVSILWNMIVTKKVGGDAYAQIIRDTDTGIIVNLIPLNPQYMRNVSNKKGRVKKYVYRTPAGTDKQGSNLAQVEFQPDEILHLCNNRVVNEIHGVSDVEAVEFTVESQKEAMRDLRKIAHRNGVVRVIEVDTDDTTKIAALKVQWKTAIDNGDVLIIPKGVAEAKDWHGNIDFAGILAYVEYLDNDFYMSIGVPRVILGGAENSIEASSKIGFLSFEQVYHREQAELEADLWNQLGIRITFNKPASLMDTTSSMSQGVAPSNPADMQQNQSQTGFQPNDVQAGAGQ